MEEIKIYNDIKTETKNYFNISKTITKLYAEERETRNEFYNNYNLIEEAREKAEEERQKLIAEYNKRAEEREEKIKKLQKTIQEKEIESNLINNNIIYLFYEKYFNIIINILDKYKNKNIGEKTKEKIQNEIAEEIEKDKVYVNVYYKYGGNYTEDIYKIYFTLYPTKEDKIQYNYKHVEFDLTECNYYNEEGVYHHVNNKNGSILIHNNKNWEGNYQYILDTKRASKEILKRCKKDIEKVNRLIAEARKTREENNKYLNNYCIKNFDFIEIKYNQTL